MEAKPLSLFGQLTDAAYKTATRYFTNEARKALVTRWQDYCANATQRLFETGDVKHAQKMYEAAVICGFRLAFQRAVVPQIPFAYDKDGGFTGKIQPGKRDALLALDSSGVQQFEVDMRHRFDNENESKPTATFSLSKRLDAVIKKDRQQETPHTDTEVRKVLNEMLKLYPAVVAVEVQAVAQGQAQEKADDAAEAAEALAA